MRYSAMSEFRMRASTVPCGNGLVRRHLMIIDRIHFDLAGLRQSCKPFFAGWDAAVERHDDVAARTERRALLNHTRAGLAVPSADAAGIYLFHRSVNPVALEDLIYIGIAESSARPMRIRIEDRLRDDSCFDPSLDDLPRRQAADVIRKRLKVAMPTSRRDYTEKHLSTCELVRASGRILLNATEAEPRAIRDAEKLLIASASALRAPLSNRKLLRFVGPASAAGVGLARSLVAGLQSHGWSDPTVIRWLGQIDRLSER
jgi:hypothetical protein